MYTPAHIDVCAHPAMGKTHDMDLSQAQCTFPSCDEGVLLLNTVSFLGYHNLPHVALVTYKVRALRGLTHNVA